MRNVELYQEINTNAGDGIIFTNPSPIDGHILIEYCYIHDGGCHNSGTGTWYAAVWIDGLDNTIVRYCEIRDWGLGGTWPSGEGVGLWAGHQTGCEVYRNLFVNVGTATSHGGKVTFNTSVDCPIPIANDNALGETVYIENNLIDGSDYEAINIGGPDHAYINANTIHNAAGVGWIHNTWYDTVSGLNSNSDALIPK